MPTLNVPVSNAPPFAIIALALLGGAELKWDLEASDANAVVYDGTSGEAEVRAVLEAKLPGKEVGA